MPKREAFKVPKAFSLRPKTLQNIPPQSVLITEAQTMLKSTHSWRRGKDYKDAETFIHKDYDEREKVTHTWHCVVSHFRETEVSFEEIWSKLGPNKLRYQKNYVSSLVKSLRVKYISATQSIWTSLFTYPSPVSPRVYTNYQASWLLEYSHKRRGIIITFPIDLSLDEDRILAELEEKGTKGLSVSVEQIQELDDGIIEWRRLACVDPGGLIPGFWAQRSAESNMIEENHACVKWLKNLRSEDFQSGSDEELDK